MKYKKLYHLLIAVLLPAILEIYFVDSSSAQSNTTVNVSPSSHYVDSGESFDIDIYIDPTVDIAGAQFDLSFNASLLQVNSVTEGNLLNQGGCGTYFVSGTINNAAGTIIGVVGAIITPSCNVSNPRTFVNISFTARNVPGTSFLNMSNVVVGNPNGSVVSTNLINGSVTVVEPGITVNPTPTSTDTLTPSPTYTPISTATATPTPTPTPTSTATATPTPTPTPTSTATATPTPTTIPPSIATPTPTAELTLEIDLGNGILSSSGILQQDIDARSSDGTATARIAAGTQITDPSGQPVDEITMEAAITIPPVPEDYYLIQAFDFGPDGTIFSSALQITLAYDLSQLPADQEPVIAYYDEAAGIWRFIIGDVETVAGTITFSIRHFTTYALMGYSATPDEHEGIASWVWIVIGLVVAVALIVIIGLAIQRRVTTGDTVQSGSEEK